MAKRIQHTEPFNRNVPQLFQKGGLIDKANDIGARVRFMVEMPDNHFSGRIWMNLYESARKVLMDICFLEYRCASDSELSQLDWLKQSGHKLWLVEHDRPRCNLNRYIEKLERSLMHHMHCENCNCDDVEDLQHIQEGRKKQKRVGKVTK